MHKLGTRILAEVKPTLEKMIDSKITEKELDCCEKMVRIAHDLIESDVMLHKMDKWDNDYTSESMPIMNPKKEY